MFLWIFEIFKEHLISKTPNIKEINNNNDIKQIQNQQATIPQ